MWPVPTTFPDVNRSIYKDLASVMCMRNDLDPLTKLYAGSQVKVLVHEVARDRPGSSNAGFFDWSDE